MGDFNDMSDKPDEHRPEWGTGTVGEVRKAGGCLYMVTAQGAGWRRHWCSRKAKPGHEHCGVHTPEARERRRLTMRERAEARSQAWREERDHASRKARALKEMDSLRVARALGRLKLDLVNAAIDKVFDEE